jgi:diadenosine tetraphosphate (Ap4A) HIT family hydrolase
VDAASSHLLEGDENSILPSSSEVEQGLAVHDVYSATGCLLCDEIRNEDALSLRLGIYDAPGDRIIDESENFVLIPDISPIVPGHSLIVTRSHSTCFARLPNQIMAEFVEFKRRSIAFVTQHFSRPFLFEHGSGSATPKSGACIHHAHLHLIPVRIPLRDCLEDVGELADLPGSPALPALSDGGRVDYLYYEDQDGEAGVVSQFSAPVPCQFIRRLVARQLKLTDWNWKSVFVRPRATG